MSASPGVTHREAVLRQAETLVMGPRNEEYSDPKDNFGQTAALWAAYLGHPIDSQDVAVLMVLAKISRIATSPRKMDHWVDIAGYAACGAEVADAE